MRVAHLASTALNFKSSSSAGSSALLARLKGSTGLSISVMQVERGVHFLAPFEGQRSTALCQPPFAELTSFSNPTAWALFVSHRVHHPPCVSWQCCGMERGGGHLCVAVGARGGGGSTLRESWQFL